MNLDIEKKMYYGLLCKKAISLKILLPLILNLVRRKILYPYLNVIFVKLSRISNILEIKYTGLSKQLEILISIRQTLTIFFQF